MSSVKENWLGFSPFTNIYIQVAMNIRSPGKFGSSDPFTVASSCRYEALQRSSVSVVLRLLQLETGHIYQYRVSISNHCPVHVNLCLSYPCPLRIQFSS